MKGDVLRIFLFENFLKPQLQVKLIGVICNKFEEKNIIFFINGTPEVTKRYL